MLPADTSNRGDTRKGSRAAYFPEHGRFIETPVYDRYALKSGMQFDGPAIFEERESTLIIGVRGRLQVDKNLNIVTEMSHEK